MLIAILDFDVAPDQRDAAMDQLFAEVPSVRAMPGNIAFRPFADPHLDGRVTLVHEWEDEAAFQAYVSGPSFARSGEVLRPMMTTPPTSRRFRAELIETVA